MTAPLLSVRNLSKSYGRAFRALTDINLDVRQGEFIALLGPSGCGKTTLLSTLAGFLAPDCGTVEIDGRDVTHLPPYRRALNTVFQNYALFPHMTVLDNVCYGPLRTGIRKAESLVRADSALRMVGLETLAARFPSELSGGQKQRVALARAIVNRPKLLLLDEPLSALDMKLRKHMQRELKELQRKLGISFIFVTHDQEEAMVMADRIVVMNHGVIEQVGLGAEIYNKPASRFVADFIGDANLLACDWVGDTLRLRCADVTLRHDTPRSKKPLLAVIRPEDIRFAEASDAQGSLQALGRIVDVVSVGSYTTYYVAVGDLSIAVRHLGGALVSRAVGAPVVLQFDASRTHFVEASS